MGGYLLDGTAYIARLLLNLIRIVIELVPLFFERADPLSQLVQRTGCGLEFAIQRLQRLSLVNSEDIGISFPARELERVGTLSIGPTVSGIPQGFLR